MIGTALSGEGTLSEAYSCGSELPLCNSCCCCSCSGAACDTKLGRALPLPVLLLRELLPLLLVGRTSGCSGSSIGSSGAEWERLAAAAAADSAPSSSSAAAAAAPGTAVMLALWWWWCWCLLLLLKDCSMRQSSLSDSSLKCCCCCCCCS
jgi:hypothetical protein